MGYPSRSLEAFYRNPMSDVEKFLDSRHEDRYKVYNLPPPFQLIHPFCEDVSDWLHTQHDHVVAVHCKAGKGRTGVMICSYLVHCGATAAEAIQWYGDKRTMDGCGVTIPSQLRYIRYYEEFLEARTLHYDPRLLLLQEIVIDTIPKPLQRLESGNNYVILTIFSNETKIYESLPGNSRVDTKKQQIRVQFPDKIVLAGDVKIMLWYDSAYKRCHLCHYFFNTTFISKDNLLSLTKNETDKACKDKLHATFDREFKIHTRFAPAFANQSPLHTLPAEATQSILLRYKNHQGPNNIQVRPPSFSTMRLTQRSRNSPWLQIFLQDQGNDTATDPKESAADTDVAKAISTTTTNNNNNINSNNTGISTSHPPVLQTKSPPTLVQQNGSVFAPKPSISAFRPSWADKDRDRGGVDDDWDTASVSSDCSESDTATEWWYTRPPQVIFGGAIAAVGGGMSGGAGGGGGHGHGHGVNGGVAGGHYQNNGKTKSPLSSPPNSRGRIIMDGSTAAGSGGSGGPTSPLAATFSPPSGPSSSSTHVPASSVLQRNEQAPLLSVSRGNLSGAMGPAAGKLHANMVDGGGSAGTSSSSSVLALLAPSILSSASASTTSSSLPPPPPPPSSSSSVPGQQQHYLPILHYQPPPSPLANEIVIEAASSSSTREHSTLSEGGVNFATNGTPGDGDEHGGRGAGSGSGSSSSSSSQQGVNSGLPIASWFMSTSLHTLSGVAGGSGSSVYSEQTNGSSPSTGRSEGDAGVGWVDTMSRWLWPSVSTTSVNEEDAVGPV
ncbi:hypothetical protein DFQ27_002183 [Actinomortierella ambigua]|uniref:Phosphatidylinositol 3,4,5-trisphosphate 3-phosphatase and dual-specificity protein phosphatase PTEN n=1 Tax=Actinomortierella ambigua TaxID=1343610 RepID=A0A9P6QJU2_9FUNG|nr:hypothetical protein DFQ27_002183 [Actinomortierella ambigua]